MDGGSSRASEVDDAWLRLTMCIWEKGSGRINIKLKGDETMKRIEAKVMMIKKIMAAFREAKKQGVRDPGKKIILAIKARNKVKSSFS